MMIVCRVAVKMMGMLALSVRKMRALTSETETALLIGRGRQNLTCFIY